MFRSLMVFLVATSYVCAEEPARLPLAQVCKIVERASGTLTQMRSHETLFLMNGGAVQSAEYFSGVLEFEWRGIVYEGKPSGYGEQLDLIISTDDPIEPYGLMNALKVAFGADGNCKIFTYKDGKEQLMQQFKIAKQKPILALNDPWVRIRLTVEDSVCSIQVEGSKPVIVEDVPALLPAARWQLRNRGKIEGELSHISYIHFIAVQ